MEYRRLIRLIKGIIINSLVRIIGLFSRNIVDSCTYFIVKGNNGVVFNPEKTIFVCKGNVCRSPFAASSLKMILNRKHLEIESYGIDVMQSNPPPPEAIVVAGEFGVNISRHVSKPMDMDRIKEADLIIVMEYSHYKEMAKLFPEKKCSIRLLREFAPFPTWVFCNINDPYGYEIEEYRKCFSLIEKSLNSFVKKVCDQKEK